jgi:hypothetical protein
LKVAAIGFIAAGLALLMGTVFAVLGAQDRLADAKASEAWPTTGGKIVKTYRARSSGAHIRYRYTVAGVDYESKQIRLVEKFWRDQPSEIVARYPEGRQVEVAYDPSHHSRAVLEPGTSWGALVKKMIAALLLGTAGLGLVWIGVSHFRRR